MVAAASPLRSSPGSRLAALVGMAMLIGACGSASPGALSSGSAESSPVPAAPATSQATAPPTSRASSPASPVPTPAPLPDAVAVKPIASIRVASPGELVEADGAIWVTSRTGISRIDPATNAVTATIKLGDGTGNDLAWISGDGDGLWVPVYGSNVVDRIDPGKRTVVAKVAVGVNPEGVAATPTGIWVANHHDGTVDRIDPATNMVVATVHLSNPLGSGPQPVAAGLGRVWVGVVSSRSVARIDPATNKSEALIHVPDPAEPCGGIAVGADAIWSSSCMNSPTLARIDPATDEVVAEIAVGGQPNNGGMGDPVLVDGAPWIPVSTYLDRTTGSSRPGTIVRIDPSSNQVDRVLDMGAAFEPFGMLVTANSVWVVDTATDGGRVIRLPLSALRG